MTQLTIDGLAPPAPPTHADAWAKRGPEARAILLASAVKRCRALAAQIADDEAWWIRVGRRLHDPALVHIPADDPMRVQAIEDRRQVRVRIDDLERQFAHWRQKADTVWGEMERRERVAAIGGLGTEGWALWYHLSDVLLAEYERVDVP